MFLWFPSNPSISGFVHFFSTMKSWVKLYYYHYIIIIIDLKPRLLSVIMQDGSFASEDLFGFLTDGDFQALGRRPNTWRDCVITLRDGMANHVVIQSAASLFALNIHIIDAMGVSTMFCYLPLIFLGAGLGEKPPPFSRRVLPVTEIPGTTPDFHSHVCIHFGPLRG